MRKWLGKDMGKVFLGWNLDESNLPFPYLFSDVVVSSIDMFHACVSFGIKGEGDGGGIITMEDGWEFSS